MQSSQPSRLFPSLALVTAVLTIGLIVFGAVVRVTDSGLGCGSHWPLCNGSIFPPLDNLTAWIEWLHRLFAALIGALGLGMLVLAWRGYRTHKRLVWHATLTAAGLYTLQALLGAIVVKLELPPTFVTLHLGTAMLLIGALLIAAVAAVYTQKQHYARDSFSSLLWVTTGLCLFIILTGALVRNSGASLACETWPLCNGDVFPTAQGQLATIHMFHRAAVLVFGGVLLLLLGYAVSQRPQLRSLVGLALLAYLAQATIGALYVFSAAAPVWGAGHVLFAALTWSALVCLCVLEVLNSRVSGELDSQWQQRSEAMPN